MRTACPTKRPEDSSNSTRGTGCTQHPRPNRAKASANADDARSKHKTASGTRTTSTGAKRITMRTSAKIPIIPEDIFHVAFPVSDTAHEERPFPVPRLRHKQRKKIMNKSCRPLHQFQSCRRMKLPSSDPRLLVHPNATIMKRLSVPPSQSSVKAGDVRGIPDSSSAVETQRHMKRFTTTTVVGVKRKMREG